MENKKERLGVNEYYMKMAILSSYRGTCLRNKVGCVLVYEKRVKAIGYNSSHSGTEHCEEVGCCMERGHCIRTLHAEEAAVLNLEKKNGVRMEAYITHEPCLHCHRILASVGVETIFYLNPYGDFSKQEKEIKSLLDCRMIRMYNIEIIE